MSSCTSHRDGAVVENVRAGDDDHGGLTVWLFLNYDGGTCQGFGGLHLDRPLFDAYVQEIRALFGVAKLEEIKGKHCFALRNFTGWNEPIIGIETDDGRRFTLHGFQSRHTPLVLADPLTWRLQRIQAQIEDHEQRVAQKRHELETIHNRYRAWPEKEEG